MEEQGIAGSNPAAPGDQIRGEKEVWTGVRQSALESSVLDWEKPETLEWELFDTDCPRWEIGRLR